MTIQWNKHLLIREPSVEITLNSRVTKSMILIKRRSFGSGASSCRVIDLLAVVLNAIPIGRIIIKIGVSIRRFKVGYGI